MISTSTTFLNFHVPTIEEDDIGAVVDVLRSGWITTGPKVREFEKAFARFTGARHTVAVSSGTAALHLALEAIGLREGDEVIVPAMTFAATGEVVLYFKARPVLVDCGRDSMNIDPSEIKKAITPRTKAIIPVHFAGHACDMDRLLEVARYHDLKIVEDAAHALPAHYKQRMVGTIGDITCFSFYATKTITTGEGGMAVTENDEYADRMRLMSLHGISKDAWQRYEPNGSWRYDIADAGYKYNLTDILAALGLAQLAKCNEMWRRRATLASKYNQGLALLDAFHIPEVSANIQHAWHLYVVLVNPALMRIHRDQVIEELRQRGIGTSVHFIPLNLHSFYRQKLNYRAGQFPRAEGYADRCISLPLYPSMSDSDVERVLQALDEIARKFRR